MEKRPSTVVAYQKKIKGVTVDPYFTRRRNDMAPTLNIELFMKLALIIRNDMNLYVNTESEMQAFIQTYPEQYQLLLKKARAALEISTCGGSFELLGEEDLHKLQGAGNGNQGIEGVCIAARIVMTKSLVDA